MKYLSLIALLVLAPFASATHPIAVRVVAPYVPVQPIVVQQQVVDHYYAAPIVAPVYAAPVLGVHHAIQAVRVQRFAAPVVVHQRVAPVVRVRAVRVRGY